MDGAAGMAISWVFAIARRMRTRSSPRCTSSSATPVSTTSLISSRISSLVMLKKHQLLRGGCQHFAPVLCHKHGVFNADTAESADVGTRFNCNHHAGFESRAITLAQAGRFVNFEAEAVAGGVNKNFT